ncbi:hypothetical protein [Micromonospora sp. NPDC126480]|uniref:WXG100 family type VII secretion target n=1 Tax=Micromonospora sp. NPDC126480 TaxID=3155312 RepID=UPI0033274F02
MPSWEEMCQQVVVAGRPGDVATAASLWEQLLKNVNAVKESLETNVKDLGEVWKGEAYEAFKTRVTGIATEADRVVKDAEGQNGIVQSLRTAADDLTAAQARFPIPASCVNDVLEARNGRLVIDTGFFEAKVKPDFLGLLDPLTSLYDWINDKSSEAAEVYGDVSGRYLTTDQGMPGSTGVPPTDFRPDMRTPDLGTGPGGTAPGGAPNLGGMPSGANLPGGGPSANLDRLPGTGTMPGTGSGAHPDLGGGSGTGYPSGGYPGTGSLADDYGSGLAGAAPAATAPGLGGGGLPGTSGLGASTGGAGLAGGGGMIPGGGSLGRPVTPGMAPMMGGGMAGAGRGGGRGGGGRLGAGGKLGAGGGMAPMMGGGMAGAGRGAGGRGAGRGAPGAGVAGRGAGGAGARGGAVAGMGGTGGAGFGDEEVPRNTWLEEDEDVWGADGDGAPGVLR